MKKVVFLIVLATLPLAIFAQKKSAIDTAEVRKNLQIDTTQFYHPHEFSLYLTPDYANMFYKGEHTNSYGGFNVGIGLDYTYWFHRNVGVSIGAKWQRYVGVYKFNNYVLDPICNDASDVERFGSLGGDNYRYHGEYNQKETQIAHYIEVPIKVTFAVPVRENVDFRAGVGFNPGFRVADRQKMDSKTSYTRTAEYIDGHYEIPDALSVGLGTYTDFIEPYKGKLFTHSFGIVADLGFAIALNENWRLHAGLTGGYGFNDARDKSIKGENQRKFHEKLPDPYSGMIVTNQVKESGVHTLFVGLKLGAAYAFGTCPNENKYRKAQQDWLDYAKDSDGDGVYDHTDECPDTPKGVVVDSVGCPVDSDGDGVPDYIDQCPDTPKGYVVDSVGCPMDDDQDGVLNEIDECPDTPRGVVVDSVGCPVDTDGDGLADYIDKCPNVPGPKSNHGCPELKREVKNLFRKAMQGIEFEFDKDVIRPISFSILDDIVKVMKENPTYLLYVTGHTDNIGRAEYNQDLSERRAASVCEYLRTHGVEDNRVTSKGFGDTKPVASNETDAGRAKNRRTEFEVIFETVTFEKIINPELQDMQNGQETK